MLTPGSLPWRMWVRITNRLGGGYYLIRTKKLRVTVWHAMTTGRRWYWQTWPIREEGHSYSLTVAPTPNRHWYWNIHVTVEVYK